MVFESGRFLHPFGTGSRYYGARSWSTPLKHTGNLLTEGRIPRLMEPRTLFGAVTIGERFVIATGGQKPNFPALSSVELFVRTGTECHACITDRCSISHPNSHSFSWSARGSLFVQPCCVISRAVNSNGVVHIRHLSARRILWVGTWQVGWRCLQCSPYALGMRS